MAKNIKEGKKDGRPSKFRDEFVEEADVYLSLCVDTYEEFHKTRGEKSDSYDRIARVKLPSHVGFAIHLDVNESTLYEWAKHSDSFSKALDKIKQAQHQRLIDGGISGSYNSTISKLILSSNHGYKEKSDITSDDKPIPILGIDFGKEK